MIQRIAITGGIASGKSLFTRYLRELGIEILDADTVVHQMEATGGAAVKPLTQILGRGVLAVDGGIDREAVAALIFSNAELRHQVNALLHPMVREVLLQWVAASQDKIRVVVIPLLFEAGWESEWELIICLDVEREVQLERLIKHRKMSRTRAEQRIAAQMPLEEKAAKSDIVIENNGSTEELKKAAERLYSVLMEKKNGK